MDLAVIYYPYRRSDAPHMLGVKFGSSKQHSKPGSDELLPGYTLRKLKQFRIQFKIAAFLSYHLICCTNIFFSKITYNFIYSLYIYKVIVNICKYSNYSIKMLARL